MLSVEVFLCALLFSAVRRLLSSTFLTFFRQEDTKMRRENIMKNIEELMKPGEAWREFITRFGLEDFGITEQRLSDWRYNGGRMTVDSLIKLAEAEESAGT